MHYLHAKFKSKGYKGKTFKDEFWGAARATNVRVFQHHIKVIQGMNAGA
jgi:hypothetical protein